jgi:hypothetical protein
MKAIFGRKMVDIEELADATIKAKKEGSPEQTMWL